jgi:hypothetical protein
MVSHEVDLGIGYVSQSSSATMTQETPFQYTRTNKEIWNVSHASTARNEDSGTIVAGSG